MSNNTIAGVQVNFRVNCLIGIITRAKCIDIFSKIGQNSQFGSNNDPCYHDYFSMVYKGKKLNKICSVSFIGYLGS